MFALNLNRLVCKTREYELFLGSMGADGLRKPGLIDRFKEETKSLIEMVARNCETDGQIDSAVVMFDLAENPKDALRLLNGQLGLVVAQKRNAQSKCDLVRSLAASVGIRYRQIVRNGAACQSLLATFYLLMDIGTFFDLFHTGRYGDALEVIRKLEIVPLSKEQVDVNVRSFHMVPDEVRRLLPDLLLATMTAVVERYELKRPLATSGTAAMETELLTSAREQAKALIVYAGMIPYRLPVDTNGRLIQLELRLH